MRLEVMLGPPWQSWATCSDKNVRLISPESYQRPLKRALQLQPCRLNGSCEASIGQSPNNFTFFLRSTCVVIHLYFAVFTFSFSLPELLVTGENHFFFQYGKHNQYCWILKSKCQTPKYVVSQNTGFSCTNYFLCKDMETSWWDKLLFTKTWNSLFHT